jgi:predicted metal-dependent phosphoesterase TrpH
MTKPLNLCGDVHRDWHIHTTCSDGTYAPAEIPAWAVRNGLEEIAVTDHDGMDGVPAALDAGRKCGIRVIPGIEIATRYSGEAVPEGTGIHLLGYGIDTQNRTLRNACEKMLDWRRERNSRLFDLLAQNGWPLDEDELERSGGNGFIGKPIFARAMVRHGYIEREKDAFSRFFDVPPAKKIKKKKYSTAEAIGLVRAAGGRPVLAHPGLIKHLGERGSEAFLTRLEAIVDDLRAAGLAGIECDYPEHSGREREAFCRLAEQRGMDITRGSDFHGGGSHGGFSFYRR